MTNYWDVFKGFCNHWLSGKFLKDSKTIGCENKTLLLFKRTSRFLLAEIQKNI